MVGKGTSPVVCARVRYKMGVNILGLHGTGGSVQDLPQDPSRTVNPDWLG